MKAGLCILGMACLMGMASAQDKTQTQTETKTQTQTTASSTANGKMAEMKTQTYKGTLVDASCAGGSAAPASTASAGDTNTANSANRSTGDCAVSANSTALALKTKDGRTLRFDLVGNQRAQDAMKTNKRWSKDLAANKPLNVTVSGVVNNDKLIVTSIH